MSFLYFLNNWVMFYIVPTDCGSMWPAPSWIGTKWGRRRRSLSWRRLSEEKPRREEKDLGPLNFSRRIPSPLSGPTGTLSMNTLPLKTTKSPKRLASVRRVSLSALGRGNPRFVSYSSKRMGWSRRRRKFRDDTTGSHTATAGQVNTRWNSRLRQHKVHICRMLLCFHVFFNIINSENLDSEI